MLRVESLQRSFLDTFYRPMGLLEEASCKEFMELQLARHLPLDHIWMALDLLLFGAAHPERAPKDSPVPIVRSKLVDELNEKLDHSCTVEKLLELMLSIADAVMESAPQRESAPQYLYEGLEATLWQAYDGLKAYHILSQRGYGAGCSVILRAAQEALLLHLHFRRNGLNAKKFKINSLYEEASDMARFYRFHLEHFNYEDEELLVRMNDNLAHLASLKCRVHINPDHTLSKPSQVGENPKWHNLVSAEEDHLTLLGNKAHVYYEEIFLDGNKNAHCLASRWRNWVPYIDREPISSGSVQERPVTLPNWVMITLHDFMLCLEKSRPQLLPHYNELTTQWHIRKISAKTTS